MVSRKKKTPKKSVMKPPAEDSMSDETGPGGSEDLANMADSGAEVETTTMIEPGVNDYDPDDYTEEVMNPVIRTNPTTASVPELAPTRIKRGRGPADARFKNRRDAIKARRERKSRMARRRR